MSDPLLYSGPLSLFTAKVRVALAEKGVAYERVEVGWSPRDRYLPHHPEVVRINPKRQVPCLVHDGLEIYDSSVILEYLEDRWPEPALMPRDPAARARCRRLELEADELLFPQVWPLIEERFYARDPAADAERVAQAERGVRADHERLEAALGEGPYLCGAYGVADIASFIFVHTAAILGVPIGDEHPRLCDWRDRVAVRPGVREELEAMGKAAQAALSA